ncbi:MAG: NUMOD3 domain-containing DNA-binding protein [Waterburya sp.]
MNRKQWKRNPKVIALKVRVLEVNDELVKNESANPNKFYVYVHRRKTDGKIFYIGRGCSGRFLSKHGRNNYWKNVVNKHGFVGEKLFTGLTNDHANFLEVYFIAKYNKEGLELTNLTNGGEGASGCKRSEETKKKLSNSLKGRIITKEHRLKVGLANKRRVISEVTRKKISNFQKGKRISIEHRMKISRAKKGLRFSEEHCRKISESKRGLKNSFADKKIYTFVHKNGDVFLGTRFDLCEKYLIKTNYLGFLFSVKNHRQSVCGWSLLGTKFSESKKDKTIHCFVKYNGEKYKGTRDDFCNNYKIRKDHINKLFMKKPRTSVCGWYLESNLPSDFLFTENKILPNVDKKEYEFCNKNGDFFVGTRLAFCKKYNIQKSSLNDLFKKNKRSGSLFGWSLLKTEVTE